MGQELRPLDGVSTFGAHDVERFVIEEIALDIQLGFRVARKIEDGDFEVAGSALIGKEVIVLEALGKEKREMFEAKQRCEMR